MKIFVDIILHYSIEYSLVSDQNRRTVGMMDMEGHDSNSTNGGIIFGDK